MKFIFQLLKKPFFGRYMVQWKNPLPPQERTEWDTFSFASKSGATLRGMIAKANTQRTKGVIVLGHPMGKEAKGYYLKNGYTNVLRDNGYHVLVFDINGFGESSTGNFDYDKDIIAAGREAQKRYPDLPLGYMGISLGGQFATIAFAEDHPYEFAVIESAANTLEDFWAHYPAAYRALQALNFLLPRYRKRIRMIDRIKKAKGLRKLLLIYLEEDEVIPSTAGPNFQQATTLPTELVFFKNAKHAQLAKSENREAYFGLITSFFDSQTRMPFS